MRIQLKMLFVGTLVGGFCACSFLGDRQESTKLDLEGSPISQIKILGKKDALVDAKKETPPEAQNLTTGTLAYESKFTHPTLDAADYILNNDIDLESVGSGESKTGKISNVFEKMDRASMFFDLGGRIAGQLKIIEPSTENLEKISASIGRPVEALPYSEPKSNEMKAKLIEKNPDCDGHIRTILGFGTAAIDLSKANLAYLNLTQSEREDIQSKSLPKDKVTPFLFTKLGKEDQNAVYVSFDPKLDSFTISIAQYFEACLPPTGAVSAMVVTDKGIVDVPAEHIKVDGDKISIEVIRNQVPNKELGEYKISNGKSLNEIAFLTKKKEQESGEAGRTPVFTMPYYKNTSKLTFLKDALETEVTPKKDEVKPEDKEKKTEAENKETQPKTEITTTSPSTISEVTLPAATPSKIEAPTTNNEVILKNKPVVLIPAPQTKNDSLPIPSNINVTRNDTNTTKIPSKMITSKTDTNTYITKNDTNATKAPSKTTKSLTMDELGKDLSKSFPGSANWFFDNWFSPVMTHNAEKNYISNGDGGFKYTTYNNRFSNYWDNSFFPQNGFTEDAVKSKCNGFDFVRTLKFPVKFSTPPENSWGSYYTISALDSDGKTTITKTKKYKTVLHDQFFATSEDGIGVSTTIENFVNGSLNTPANINQQTFDIKLCFNQFNSQFQAYWSSDDTRAKSYTIGGVKDYNLDSNGAFDGLNSAPNNKVAFAENNPNAWFQGQTTEAKKRDQGYLFPSRKPNAPHSDFHVSCKEGTCYGIFHLTFRRDLAPPKLFAYVNRDDLWGPFGGKYRAGLIKSVMSNRSDKGDINRNEIVIFGGFEFKTTDKESAVAYITPKTLKSKNVVNYNESKITFPIFATFPGESADLYLPVIADDQASTQVYASR